MLPDDFKPTGAPELDSIFFARAELMFGPDWRHKTSTRRAPNIRGWRLIKVGDRALKWSFSTFPRLIMVSTMTDKYHDPAPMIPAHVVAHKNGQILSTSHYFLGDSQNPRSDVPCEKNYYATGEPRSEVYFTSNKKNDPSPGSPAETEWHLIGGKIKRTVHRKNGDYKDLPDGTPAIIAYDQDGIIEYGHSSLAGDLTAKEVEKLLYAVRRTKCESLIGQSAVLAMRSVGSFNSPPASRNPHQQI